MRMQCRRVPLIILATSPLLLHAAEPSKPARSLSDLTGPWQLLVDDYLIASRENVARTYHSFEKHPANPVMKPDQPWEGSSIYLYGTILPEEDGTGLRMWYHALPGDHDYYRLLYATSKDGLQWDKPALGIVDYQGSKANNIFIRRGKRDHISSVIHTPFETDPTRQYLMINFDGDAGGYMAAWSRDGIRWTDAPGNPVFKKGGDVSQFLYDFHAGQYVGYVKNNINVSGMRRRAVARVIASEPTSWSEPRMVIAPDSIDDRWAKGVQRTHFYGLSAFAYETMYLGFIWVYRATDNEGYFDGPVFVELVSSRDGIQWQREEGDRPPILAQGPKEAWDWGMVCTPQHPVLKDGKLWLYYGGFSNLHAAPFPWHSSIGLATLRKDGFVSLDAREKTGVVTTKRLANTGRELRVNCETAAGGSVRVEVLDEQGKPIAGYATNDCRPLSGDSIDQQITWGQKAQLPPGRKQIRLRFILDNASLYSFMAGETVKVIDEPAASPLAALYTFEDGWSDALGADGRQGLRQCGDPRVDDDAGAAAFGKRGARIGSEFSPLQTLEIEDTRSLGTQFTLALMVRSKDNKPARLFSAYGDRGPVRSDELIFECDPSGQCLPGLRLVVNGVPVDSKPLKFDDGRFHHVAVSYNDGEIHFYLDGRESGESLIPGGSPVSLRRNLLVGEDAEHGREEQLRGHIDDVLVLGRAMNAAQIKVLADRGAEALFAANKQLLSGGR